MKREEQDRGERRDEREGKRRRKWDQCSGKSSGGNYDPRYSIRQSMYTTYRLLYNTYIRLSLDTLEYIERVYSNYEASSGSFSCSDLSKSSTQEKDANIDKSRTC